METLALWLEASWDLLGSWESPEIDTFHFFDPMRAHKFLHLKDKIFSYIVLRELPGFAHIKVSKFYPYMRPHFL